MAKRQSSKKTEPFNLLWQMMAGFRAKYVWAICALFVFTVINFTTPLVASATIDYAIAGEPDDGFLTRLVISLIGGQEFIKTHLWFPALLMVFLTITAGAFSYLKGRFAAHASDGIARNLKNRLFDHLQHLPTRYHDRAETGDLIQRCTSDVETLRLALSTQVVDISNALLLLVTALPIMILLDERMALFSLILVAPIIAFGFAYIRKVKHLFTEVAEAEGQVTRMVQENLTGLRVVRAFARQDFEIAKFAKPNRRYRDRSLRLLRMMSWYWSISDLIVFFQQGLALFMGIWFISQGTLTVGTLFAFLMFLNMLLWPIRQMGRTLTELGKSAVALRRMGEILAEPRETIPVSPANPKLPLEGRIEVKNLEFSHGEAAAAINGISFTVEPGETLAILGPSGSGKSTMMHLLLRLYDYNTGSIKFDGHELKELDRKWLRSQFGVVMQEPFLYSKSVGENIRFGRGHAFDDEVHEAARIADIHDTINSFPSGYSTLVGERGVTLSGGQRQRVAIARALLKDAPVLLLDDALSAVDAETEAAILDALLRRQGNRTTLVIAHRLSTLAHADKVIVLDKGKIIQHGSHDELSAQDGMYRRLWKIQNTIEGEIKETANQKR